MAGGVQLTAILGSPTEGDAHGLSVSWDPELPSLLARLRSSAAAEAPRNAFEHYARTAPTLAPIQFEKLLRDWEPSITKTQVASFWQEADANHDGQLTFEEFFQFLRPGLSTTGTEGEEEEEEEAGAPLPPSSVQPALLGAGSNRGVRVAL